MNSPKSNSIMFNTKTVGIIRYIWSVDNEYYTEYDSISFGVRSYKKTVIQGSYKGLLECNYDINKSELNYNNLTISVVDSVQNIFTLLGRLSKESSEKLDAIWFPMNHEGVPHKARFLLATTESIEVNGNDILCDHYRLDIEETAEPVSKVSPYDYFTDHIASPQGIRQLWVEKTGSRRIIKASVSIYGMTLIAEIQQ